MKKEYKMQLVYSVPVFLLVGLALSVRLTVLWAVACGLIGGVIGHAALAIVDPGRRVMSRRDWAAILAVVAFTLALQVLAPLGG